MHAGGFVFAFGGSVRAGVVRARRMVEVSTDACGSAAGSMFRQFSLWGCSVIQLALLTGVGQG